MRIKPVHSTLPPGEQLALSVHATDPYGSRLSGLPVTWSSIDSAVVTVGDDGMVTARGIGNGVVAAQVGGRRATARINVIPRRSR